MPTKQELYCAAFGAVIGFSIGGSLGWAFEAQQRAMLGYLSEWQTLISGLLALVGAYLTVRGIRSQINQAYDLAEQARLREEQAAKAVMPLALSQLNQYAEDCIRLLDMHLSTSRNHCLIPNDKLAPRIPTDGIEALSKCARYADEDAVRKVAGLLGKLQVQHTRLEKIIEMRRGSVLTELDALPAMTDAADLYAVVNALYAYSRNEEEIRKRSSVEELSSAIRNCGIWDKDHPIFPYIKLRA